MNRFTYQWSKKGSDSLPNKASGVNGTVLTIPNLLKSDEGRYYCTVTNEWGRSKQSNDVTLNVEGSYMLYNYVYRFVIQKSILYTVFYQLIATPQIVVA